MLLRDNLPAVFEELRAYLLTIAKEEIPMRLAAKADASDLVQETCEAALRCSGQYRGNTPRELRAWLAQILRSRAHALRRRYLSASSRRATHEVTLSGATASSAPLQLPDTSPTPCDTAIRTELNNALRSAIAALPDEERQIIALRMEKDLPFAAIAEQLSRSETTVRRLFGRAIDLLRVDLQNHA